MTSEARETSWDQGQPVEFFRFTRGNVHWYYSSSDFFETLGEGTYTPAAIARSAIKQGAERAKNSIKVTLPSNLPVAGNWRPYPSNQTIALTIFARHVGEDTAMAVWVGRVVKPSFDGAVLTLTCEPTSTAGRGTGSKPIWQRACGVALFSKGLGKCNVDPEAVAVAGTLTAVSGTTLTAAGFTTAPRSLEGGRLDWVDGSGATQSRTITSHSGSDIVIASAITGLPTGAAVTAFTTPLWKSATLTSVSGLTLKATEFGLFASGRLAGGFIEWTRADGLTESRSIRTHSGTDVVIDYGAADLAVNLAVRAYPGCAHNWADCGFFENQLNYDGALWKPSKNPFSGMPVW